MPTTPARKSSIGTARRGPQKAHIPYRGDNPEVGKKTGIAVRHVERKSDGFEPFDELIEQADKRTPPRLKVSKKRKQSIPAPEDEYDEFGEISMDIDSPRQYFANSRQTVTPTANRNGSSSRTVARTSDIDFDRIPSPRSSRKSTGPGPSRLSSSYVAPDDDSDDNDNAPDYGYGGDYDDQPDGSGDHDIPQGTSFREMDQDDDEQQEQPDEEPEETPPPSKRDKGKGRATLSDVPEERESEIEDEIAQSLEDVRGQTYSDEEPPAADGPEPEPEPEPSLRRAKKIKIAEDLLKPSRQKNGRSKKENRTYREGVRKSARQHYKPLEYWRGEKAVYGRPPGAGNGHVLVAPIKEIIRIPKETPEPLGKRKRSTRRKAALVTNPESGWDDNTDNFCVLLDYNSGEEVERRIAFLGKDVADYMVASKGWSFMKAFGDAEFIAAGILEIPPGEKKPTKQTKDNTYIFYVIEGTVNLRIHNSNRVLARGAMFMVPRGNSYYIENVCDRNVKLFFTQARKVIEDIAPSFAPPRRSSVGVTASHGRSSSAGAVHGETRTMSGAPAPRRATSTR
ncbi:hypothetical protein C0995_014084 [Termitomyces sp. Mi166|nr:hypothetical protein C0995_014084 [Termitomyces sp. Mi166\